MSFIIDFKDEAKRDIVKHQKSGQKKLIEKIKIFTIECQNNPRIGTGKPEQLRHQKDEIWSRRINEQHRFVYEIKGDFVYILSAWGHYNDK
ncbi:MAG: Txe/YoeB family addiction module toxin [Pedobacter sp.]|nr:MAG: Txe/YoeB family addiction module toxin [Pedobacter sp.]